VYKLSVNVGLVLIGFFIGFALPTTHAQEVPNHIECDNCGSPSPPLSAEDIPIHNYSLNMRDVIEILANYDLRHVDPVPGTPFYGATDMDNHTIYIVKNQDFVFTERTVIHEIGHVIARKRDEKWDEDTVGIFEDVEYRRLFVEK